MHSDPAHSTKPKHVIPLSTALGASFRCLSVESIVSDMRSIGGWETMVPTVPELVHPITCPSMPQACVFGSSVLGVRVCEERESERERERVR
jgi:hypothetical protein